MKKLYVLVIAVAFVSATQSYAGIVGETGTLTLNLGQYQWGNGGEFLATPTSVTTGSSLGSSFQTFCLEYNEQFTPSSTIQLTYQVNVGAVSGGVSGQNAYDPYATASTPVPKTSGSYNMDIISVGTAWLYSQFRTGGLTISSALAAGNFQDAM